MIRVTTLIDFSAHFAIKKKSFECGLAKHLPLISTTFSKNCYNKSAFFMSLFICAATSARILRMSSILIQIVYPFIGEQTWKNHLSSHPIRSFSKAKIRIMVTRMLTLPSRFLSGMMETTFQYMLMSGIIHVYFTHILF